ncbi:MAG: ribosome silencing factor [Eubacterium sp.]|nr:ribosome silencing factor [Eubacterium sp.]
MDSKQITKIAFDALEDKKGVNIKVIDISNISILADYFIIAGGTNENQVKALADNVEEKLAEADTMPRQIEGYDNANWILMDYQDVIIHIFNEQDRLFFDLERIWSDGQLVDAKEF